MARFILSLRVLTRCCGLTLKELAQAIDAASAGTVSVAARRFAQRLETDRRLRAVTAKAEAHLSNVIVQS